MPLKMPLKMPANRIALMIVPVVQGSFAMSMQTVKREALDYGARIREIP
jgi:hypothetical protein